MIRDPSDGSVKPATSAKNAQVHRPTSAENWGMKSLDKPRRIPKPAPTAEELRQHYATHNLGFQPKEQDAK